MLKFIHLLLIAQLCIATGFNSAMAQRAANPVLHADIPDLSMIRVGKNYYMSSTTMHMSPGVPIMKSNDLVNWKIISYAYDTLAGIDELNLRNGKSTYGRGSWASSLRYHNGVYYVTTFAQTTGKTHVYSTGDIEKGPWKSVSFSPSYHDHSLFFDDDGRIYMVYGAGKIKLIELNKDLSGVKTDVPEKIIIENAGIPSGTGPGLPAEGSQLFKINGKYYLFNISWPRGGMRTVIVHRSDKITGPYEGKIGLQDLGVAQGGLISTPQNKWFAYLFRDNGAVGRIPYLVPVTWENDWPVLGTEGKVPMVLDLPASKGLIPGIVASDHFSRGKNDKKLPLVWQWNHNPDNKNWSLTERPGYLRLTTGRIDTSFLYARNTLTQRTIGPECTGTIVIDVSKIKNGDLAGFGLLQKGFGLVGVKKDRGALSVVMINAEKGTPETRDSIVLTQNKIFLRISCDFNDRRDSASFYYSLNGKSWSRIGNTLKMSYTIPHFMGYRFALFNYATLEPGGSADFDYFEITDKLPENKSAEKRAFQ